MTDPTGHVGGSYAVDGTVEFSITDRRTNGEYSSEVNFGYAAVITGTASVVLVVSTFPVWALALIALVLIAIVAVVVWRNDCFLDLGCKDAFLSGLDYDFTSTFKGWWHSVTKAGSTTLTWAGTHAGKCQVTLIGPRTPVTTNCPPLSDCDDLNPPGSVFTPLWEGNEDEGRIHIEREHSFYANNTKSHFLEGVAEDMGALQVILATAISSASAEGIAWYESQGNCVLDVPMPNIGVKTNGKPLNRIRVVVHKNVPYNVITMYPR